MSNYISKKELADLIEKGLQTPGVKESPQYYLVSDGENGCIACALGLAYVGLVGDAKKADERYWENYGLSTGFRNLAGLLNIPLDLATRINSDHVTGTSAIDIASQLREEED